MVNNLFTKFGNAPPARPGPRSGRQIDKQVMKDAVILPAVYQKSLLYRNPTITNVYVQSYYGMYNYAVMGVK